MQLSLMTWPEVDARIETGACVILPTGSTEQHGPMGLIGTDAICARDIALGAARICDAIVAPEMAYTPAPFNTAFPGTVSIDAELMQALVFQVCSGLLSQGFLGVFILNGHGANVEPVKAAIADLPDGAVHIRSWWEPTAVNDLRKREYGDWEGMHATPSEVAITQSLHGAKPLGVAATPPERLSADYIAAHAGDKHGPPGAHRAQFPDGRVGSHSALASPAVGDELLRLAATCFATEFDDFQRQRLADRMQ